MVGGRVSVTDVKIVSIKPLVQTDHTKVIRPSFQDLWMSDFYMPAFFAYKLSGNSDAEYQKFSYQLKESLAKVLVSYFPYAGRWVTDGGPWTADHTRGLILECNDAGVPFIEGYVDKEIDSVVRPTGGFEASPELDGFESLGLDSSSFTQKVPDSGLPPVFVQVTRFKCGGVTLASTFHHLHCDVGSFTEFMTSWAEVARTGKISIVPKVDREPGVTFEPFYSQLHDGRYRVLDNLLQMNSPYGGSEKSTMRVYEVSAAAIKELKNSVKEKSGQKQYVSTNDCIAAQLWRMAAFVPPSMSDGLPTFVLQLAENRDKGFDPPLTNLIGNVVFPTLCPMSPGPELQKEPLDSIALKIRTDLLQTDWKGLYTLDRLESLLKTFSGEHNKVWVNASWTKFGVYNELNFGVGGPPYFFPGLNTLHNFGIAGFSFVLPPIPGHSSSAATVSMFGPPALLDSVEASPEFWKFFLPWEQANGSSHQKYIRAELEGSGN